MAGSAEGGKELSQAEITASIDNAIAAAGPNTDLDPSEKIKRDLRSEAEARRLAGFDTYGNRIKELLEM